MTSNPSAKRRLKWPNASSNPSSTIGRGGMVLASFRCSFALKASSTGLARAWVALILGNTAWASSQGCRAFGASLTCWGHSAASKKIRRSSRRLVRASASSSPIEARCEVRRPFASANDCWTSLVGMLVSSVRWYVFVTKSSSWIHSQRRLVVQRVPVSMPRRSAPT